MRTKRRETSGPSLDLLADTDLLPGPGIWGLRSGAAGLGNTSENDTG